MSAALLILLLGSARVYGPTLPARMGAAAVSMVPLASAASASPIALAVDTVPMARASSASPAATTEPAAPIATASRGNREWT